MGPQCEVARGQEDHGGYLPAGYSLIDGDPLGPREDLPARAGPGFAVSQHLGAQRPARRAGSRPRVNRPAPPLCNRPLAGGGCSGRQMAATGAATSEPDRHPVGQQSGLLPGRGGKVHAMLSPSNGFPVGGASRLHTSPRATPRAHSWVTRGLSGSRSGAWGGAAASSGKGTLPWSFGDRPPHPSSTEAVWPLASELQANTCVLL